MIQLALVVLCVLIFTAADYFAARWGITRDRTSLALALLIGPFAYVLFGHLAAQTSMARMGGYVSGGIVLATALGGVLLLGEKPDRTTWLGLATIVVGLTLLAHGQVQRGQS